MKALSEEQRGLVERHVWLARQIANVRFAKRKSHADYADIFSDAQLGLLRAAARFDTSAGVLFKTFAPYAINGAITDGFRDRDPVTRRDRNLANEISQLQGRFAKRHGRLASDRELAVELELPLADLVRRVALIRHATPLSLDAEIPSSFDGGEPQTLLAWIGDPSAEDELAAVCARALPETVLERLLPRERLVIALYYWDELTMLQIAEILGVTESRVSQIRSRALERLRGLAPRELAEAA